MNGETYGAVLQGAVELVLTENRQVLERVGFPAVQRFIAILTDAERIFVVGEGRSGLAVRMAAMRLMHLGCRVFVVGETTTPALQSGDLLIAVSGSGTTKSVTALAAKTKTIDGQVVAVTTQAESPLGQAADLVITIPAAAKQDYSQRHSTQFAGSLFEQAVLLLFDAIFHTLANNILHKESQILWALHANLE